MKLDQEKRVMIAFALSIVMLIVYRIYFVKEQPPEPKKAEQVVAAAKAAPPGTPATATPGLPAVASAPVALPVSQGAKAEEIVVENKFYRVTFSTVGAVVRSWVLKGYPKGEQIDTINPGGDRVAQAGACILRRRRRRPWGRAGDHDRRRRRGRRRRSDGGGTAGGARAHRQVSGGRALLAGHLGLLAPLPI